MNIELIILAAVAVFVISRLYAVLGQRTGAEPPRRRAAAPARGADPEADEAAQRPKVRPAFSGPGAAGLEAIAGVDRSFDPEQFSTGARRAYEMIVGAFADGDHATLKGLLDDDVYLAYSRAIEDREGSGAEPLRLVKLRSARIADASLTGDVARVAVSFEADLSDGEHPRSAREIWTFKRSLSSRDPNWLLDEVLAVS